eukprot:TRINITY_DN9233_c0_g4_i1.p1 TRINITY_DN9233_c0_g4~~TRINITY_DN9233_c0_g4_i1.p1  ORF type:complete len:435 (+),score=108.31 TRINITY_DN9233_c0_g4_i1:81-1385(+)
MRLVLLAFASLVLLLSPRHSAADLAGVIGTGPGTYFSGTDFGVKMTADVTNKLVKFSFSNGNGPNWVAMGPSAAKLMAGTYGYVCDANAMSVLAYDITFNDFKGLALSPKQNLQNVSVTKNNGLLVCNFTRPIAGIGSGTQDSNVNIDVNNPTYFTWAVSDNRPALTADIHDARGAFMSVVTDAAGTVTLTGVALKTNAKVVAHAALMIIAWFYALPAATIISRFFKSKLYWLKAHKFLNYYLLVSVTSSFIVIYTFEALKFINTIPHHVFGVFIIIVMFTQAILGGFKPTIKSFDSKWKVFWDYAHQISGYSLYVFAFINAMIGTMYIDNSADRTAIIVACVLPLVVYLLVFAYFQYHSKENQEQFDADFDYKLQQKMNTGKVSTPFVQTGFSSSSAKLNNGVSGAASQDGSLPGSNFGRFKTSADFDARFNH